MNEHEIYDYDDTLVITNTRKKQLEEEALAHHGIFGMKWGVRRYQNEDGSLTELGRHHYGMLERKQELEYDRRNRKEEADVERARLRYQRETDKQNLSNQKKADKDKYWLQRDQRVDDFVNNERERKHARKQFVTALAVGAVAVGGGIALHHYLKKKGQEAINSPKLTDAITAGSEKVEDIMKGAPLTFGSKSNKLSFANKYDFGNTANRGNNTKSTFTFGEMLLDDVKKDIKSKKGFSIDHDDAERLRDFASSAPFREAQRGIANRRAKTIAQNIAAHEKAKKLDNAVNDTVTRIGSGRFGNPTAMMPSQKWTTSSWGNANDSNRYTRTPVASLLGNLTDKYDLVSPVSKNKRPGGALNISDEQLRKESLDWLYDAQKKRGGYEKAIERAGGKIPTEASNIVDLLAKKAAYDTSVSNLGSDLDKTLKKFKHSNIGDAYDMIDLKLMHTAMAISSRRRAQLENRDDYLMHDGRKGMKWGKNIFTEDELKKRQTRSVDPNQYAQQLLAEANRRKQNHQNTSLPGYGDGVPLTQNTSNPGYGDGTPLTQNTSLPGYGDGVLLNTEKKSTAKVEPRQKHDPTINVRGKQVSTEDIEKQKNKNDMEDLAKDTAQTIDNVNKGNTGNGTVDALINAKNNRYKMMYDLVVPTKETNKTENRRLDTANSEPHLKRDSTVNGKSEQASTEDIEKQKNKSDAEDLAKDTAQAIDNVNKGNTGNSTVDALINAKNNRYKMMYDMVVPTKETNKTENRRLDTANESNSSPDRLKKKIIHTAIAISNRRRAQLENRDDYLMHYGRKGMKWGEDIFAEDELNKRQSGSQNQYAQQLKAEAYKRKYGNTSATTNDDAARANGAAIRARQKAIREAQAKYGGGSNSNYANQQMAKQAEESRRVAQNKAASEKYGNKYGSVGQGSSYVNGQISNQQKKTAENMEYASSIERTTDRYIDDYMSRNKNAQLYKSMAVDTAMNDAERLGNAELSNIMSGKNELASKQRNTRDNLENTMKNEIKKNIHDDIDAHSDGLTPAQIAQMKGKADIAIDKKFDQIHTRYSSNGLALTNENVKSTLEKGAEELGRNYAMSTGGLHDVSEYKPLLTVDDDAVETAGVKGEEVAPKAEAPAPKAEAPAPKAEAPAPKAEGAPKKMTAKQNHIQSNGLRDHGSFTNNNIDITAESIYDAGNSRNVQKIEEMQGLIEDRYKDVLNLQQNPRFNNKYGSKIQQELDNLMHDYGWLERRKRLAARYAEDYAFID